MAEQPGLYGQSRTFYCFFQITSMSTQSENNENNEKADDKPEAEDTVNSSAENVGDSEQTEAASVESGDPTEGLPEKMQGDNEVEAPDLDPESIVAAAVASAAANAEAENSSEAGDAESTEPEATPEEQIESLQEQIQGMQQTHDDDLLRMQAEIQNQRKRLEAQADRSRKFALEGFAKELLEVKDSLEMGLDAARVEGADISSFIEGSDMTLKKLSQTFEKHNIAEIDPVDEKFNPELHEAMTQQPVEGKEPNTVVGVIQKGYTLNGRVIRAARVMVAK